MTEGAPHAPAIARRPARSAAAAALRFTVVLALVPATAPAAELHAVTLQNLDDGTRLVLDLDAEVDVRLFTLSDPERVVIDIAGAEAAPGLAWPAAGDGPVAAIRHARRGVEDLRVVLDLREMVVVRRDRLAVAGQPGRRLVVDLLAPPAPRPRATMLHRSQVTRGPLRATASTGPVLPAPATDPLEQRIAELERAKAAHEEATRALLRAQERLEQRLRELEMSQVAQQDATRMIIRDSVATMGSQVNESVSLGGALEVVVGRQQAFAGKSDNALTLATAELDLEIQANEWTTGVFTLEYDDGGDTPFRRADGSASGVDRFNVQAANITAGNTQRFPLFGTFGRMTVPFGTSTGKSVTDTLTIQDPLTVEVFETREDALLLGIGFPTPKPAPRGPPVAVPPVKPQLLAPVIGALGRGLGYEPLPRPPSPPALASPPAPRPMFNAGIYAYDGETREGSASGWTPEEHFGATVGFHRRGECGQLDDEQRSWWCPWSVDVALDYNHSVFDSRFLETEFRGVLDQVGHVPGMAGSVKATVGAFSLVGEWNGAVGDATFTDGSGRAQRIRPRAWGVSLGYQLDWNPWVESIGDQGTYLALGYSESHDLAGSVPRQRILVHVGEWLLDGVKFAVEYSHDIDYATSEGGTGGSANGVFSSLSYVW